METNKLPIISVLMPAYNAEDYIVQAIESILNQTYKDFEFIIIDDGSKDTTWKIIQNYSLKDTRIKAIKNESNLQICKTLNKGLAIARGKYIAHMDADDWSYPDRLQKQLNFMESNPDIIISGGTMEVCDKNLRVISKRTYNLADGAIRSKIFRYSPFCHASTICRTATAKEVGGYNNSLADAEDYDYYFRLGQKGHFANLADTIYKMRTNNAGVSLLRARRQELLTLYIRLKASIEYDYPMSKIDKLYWTFQYLSMFLIPPRIKYWMFNLLRNN